MNGRSSTGVLPRAAQTAFRTVADACPLLIWVTDANDDVVWLNRRWYEFTGRTPTEELGVGWQTGIHPEDAPRVIAAMAEIFQARQPYEVDYRLRRRDGVYRWVFDTGVPQYGVDGEFIGYVGSCIDITERIDAESAHRIGESRFRGLIEHSLDLVSIYGSDGCFTFASPSHQQVLDYAPEELIGTDARLLLHPDEMDVVAKAFAAQLVGGEAATPIEHRIRHRDGSYRWIESIAVDLTHDPAVGGVLVNARDITDRRRAELLAADQARILGQVARGEPLADTLTEVVRMVERWTPGALGAILTTDDEESGSLRVAAAPNLARGVIATLASFPVETAGRLEVDEMLVVPMQVDPADPRSGQMLLAAGFRAWWARAIDHADAGIRLGAVVALLDHDRAPEEDDRRLFQVAANVSAIAIERDQTQARLSHQANHDALTGLANREVVLERLRHLSGSPSRRRGGANTAVLFLDIDRFKVLNDSVGHGAGDRLLVEMGARLNDALRPGDLVARFGGDEFVMVCEGVGDEREAQALAERVLATVRVPFMVGGHDLVVTASIGIAMVDGRDPELLLRDADAAMYSAKDRGRARAELFDDALRARVVARLEVERDLRRAVEEHELVLHYQPIVSLESRKLAGFEALVRWPHRTLGLLGPDSFLAVAEETGLVRPIGSWVRDEAFRQAARWKEGHPEWGDLLMAVNLAAAELHDPGLLDGIERAVGSTGVDASLLVFEVTERLLVADVRAASALLASLREMGARISLDDFGTGVTPLTHLKELPIDSIKIDRAFVTGLGTDRFDDAVVATTVDLCRRLGLFAVAEGVETEAQEEHLRRLGCLLAQGHLYAAALSAEEVGARLAAPPVGRTFGPPPS